MGVSPDDTISRPGGLETESLNIIEGFRTLFMGLYPSLPS